jgi:hypothetical protein
VLYQSKITFVTYAAKTDGQKPNIHRKIYMFTAHPNRFPTMRGMTHSVNISVSTLPVDHASQHELGVQLDEVLP